MTEPERPERVYCRRLERELPVHEHARCPYCFGERAEIEGGEHADFCDFDEKKDPVNFGFPPDSSRRNG